MPKDYRLPLSGVSTHKSINPYSLKIINPDETVTVYDGSDEAIIDLSDSKHAELADKVILASKQYTNVIGTADTDVDCRFYFLQIRPSTWSAAWHIKLKLTIFVNNNLQAYGHYECTITGERDKGPAYANFNTYYDDSHQPIYNTILYVLTESGYMNGQQALFGIDLRQAWNGFNSGYERTVNVELIETDNCQCSFLDNVFKATEMSSVNTSNYHSVYVMNAHEYGLQETGDKDAALRVYRQSIGYDDDYPFLISRTKDIGTPDVDNSYSSIYGAIANANHPTINLATGVVKVPRGIISIFTGDLIGNADSATEFASDATVTLEGDTIGISDGSRRSWTVTTKTDRLSTEGDNRAVSTVPNDYKNKLIFRGLKTNSSFDSPSSDDYSYVIGLRGWSDSSGGDAHELAFNNSGIFWRHGATTEWGAWERLVTSINYVDYTVTHDGVGATGNWEINVTGNAGSATKLQTARKINNTLFDGTIDITTALWGTARNISISDSDGTHTGAANSINGSADVTLKLPATIKAALNGNADSATKLQTARTINGTSFNGTANITTATWGTARTITIGATGKSVNGSANVSWSKAEIIGSGTTGQFLRGDHVWSSTLIGTLTVNAIDIAGAGLISFVNSGSWGSSTATFPNVRGGLYWSGTSDWVKVFCEETASDNFNLIADFGDDASPSFILRDRGTNKITLTPSSSTITATNFNGNASTATALTSNAGNATHPIYFSGGKPVATTYALSATVNGGTASRFAYYTGANSIGSYTGTVGNAYTPIYFNGGVPTTVNVVQYTTWTIASGATGVTISKGAYTANTYVLSIVVTSGEQYLNNVISWTSASGKITLSTVPTSGIVTGYILTAIGTAI